MSTKHIGAFQISISITIEGSTNLE